MGVGLWPGSFMGRALVLVGVSTFVLTASFVGLLAVFSAGTVPVGDRVPYYLILMGLAFVATVLVLEEHQAGGRVVIITASVVGVVAFVGSLLTVEGVLFAVNRPEEVFVTRLVQYFIAAALIGTGFAYWGVRHWREFTGQETGGL